MKKLQFPQNFLWGAATSAEQSEGNINGLKGKTIWDAHYEKEKDKFYQKVGPQITSDFVNNYKNDLKLFKKIGINSLRLSFSWARIFPHNNHQISQEGIKFYHNLIDEASKLDIKLIFTLYHFDMPLWAMNKGGWESNEVVNDFVKYANVIFNEYNTKITMFATMNEPIIPIYGGYLFKFHWPLVQSEKRAFQASFGIILAHAKVVNLFNNKYKQKSLAKIGIIINVANSYPKDGDHYTKADQQATYMSDVMSHYAFLDPMIKGTFPKELIQFLEINNELMPQYTLEQIHEIAKVKIDFLGVNFYGPSRVQAPTKDYKSKYKFQQFAQSYKWDKAVMNVFRGWEIYPKAIYDIAKIIKDKYNNLPFYISESGMGVQNEGQYRDAKTGQINDDYRIAFVNEHLYWCHKAISDGANLFGYHMWAIFDCWSWLNAYKNRYGFIEIDLKNQKRIPKKSALWFKKVATTNAIDQDFKSVQEVINLTKVKFKKSI